MSLAILGLTLGFASTATVEAKEVALPAALPAETFLYTTFDAEAFTTGIRDLDLAKLLRDPEVAAFLAPMYAELAGVDGKDPVASALEMSPHADWLTGEMSFGLAGFEFARGAADAPAIRLSPDRPVSAKLLHSLAGWANAEEENSSPSWFFVDGLLAIEPGAQLRQMVEEFLAQPPAEFAVSTASIAGRDATVVDIAFPDGKNTRFYADMSGPRWVIGGLRSTFEAALRGGRQDSLANSRTFQRFESRLTAGKNALFALLDAKRILEMMRSFVPPIALEEAELLGLDSVRGLGVGLSFVEGSVRESVLLAFDGAPRGLLAPLAAISGGLTTLDAAPGNTAFFAGLKLDLQRLVESIRAESETLLPGARKMVDEGLAEVEVGSFDLLDEVLPTFGGEVSLALGVPRNGPIPDARFVLELRDPSRFPKFLAYAREALAGEGVEIRPLPLPDGTEGFSVVAPGAPVQPAFAISGNRLIGAISGYALRSSLANQAKAPEATLDHDAGFAALRRGFAGCPTDGTALWLHVDLGKVVPMLYETLAPMVGVVANEEGLPIDAAQLPLAETLIPYLKSVAVALHCDEGGISIDAVSPTGLLGLGVAGAILQARHEAAMAEFEVMTGEFEDAGELEMGDEEPPADDMDDGDGDGDGDGSGGGGGKSDN